MRAIVTSAFNGVPDRKVYPVRFEPGAELSGDLAREAIAGGWAIDPDGKPLPPDLERTATSTVVAGPAIAVTAETGPGDQSSDKPAQPDLRLEHTGRGRYVVKRGDERVTDPLSKEAAQAELDRLLAA